MKSATGHGSSIQHFVPGIVFDSAAFVFRFRWHFDSFCGIEIRGVKSEFNLSSQRSVSFQTTCWSIVVRAGQHEGELAEAALDQLCRNYWYPLYSYVRRRGYDTEAAKDLTQGFFAEIFERRTLASADENRGRFRTFLLTAMNHFVVNEWERGHRQKRGGGREILSFNLSDAEARFFLEPQDPGLTPEQQFDRRWVESLLENVLNHLRSEFQSRNEDALFDTLKVYLVDDRGAESFAVRAAQLQMSEAALKGVVRRLRGRYREILREVVEETVAEPGLVDEEIRHLITLLNR